MVNFATLRWLGPLGSVLPPRPPEGTRWGGRAKGTPNKANQSIREAIQMAFEQAGGVEYLVRLAQEDPKPFVPLLIKTCLRSRRCRRRAD